MKRFMLSAACLLLVVVTCDAFNVGDVVWVNDPPKYVGKARLMAKGKGSDWLVSPAAVTQPKSQSPWFSEPESKLVPLPQSLPAPPAPIPLPR